VHCSPRSRVAAEPAIRHAAGPSSPMNNLLSSAGAAPSSAAVGEPPVHRPASALGSANLDALPGGLGSKYNSGEKFRLWCIGR
jgi:hypothetical protein